MHILQCHSGHSLYHTMDQFVSLYLNNIMHMKLCFLTSSVAIVNFNQDRYTVAENDGQVSVSLRIDGKFFYPVWAIIEVSSRIATGGLCMIKSLDIWTPHPILIYMCTYNYSIVCTDLIPL